MTDFNDDDGHITIVAGRHRHWRTVSSTTVTLAGRLETVLFFHGQLLMPHPQNDYYNALMIYQMGASIVSPMPGLAAHVEKYDAYRSFRTEFDDSSEYVSLYYNWFDFGKSLVHLIKSEFEISMWKLVENYSRRLP